MNYNLISDSIWVNDDLRTERSVCPSSKATVMMAADDPRESKGEPVQIPIEGELDLHTFNPRDIKELLPAYFAACQEKGIFQVRVVHGKGIGNLRRTVHAMLARMPGVVASYSLAGEHFGGWGATIVNLREVQFPAKEIPPDSA